jgi:hypothetical protein
MRQFPSRYPGSKCSSTPGDSEVEEEAVSTPLPGEGSNCSEEEIFEGYVDEESTRGGCGEWEEPADNASREVPVHVLTELKNVLAVRKHERERKRMHHHGNHGGAGSISRDTEEMCDNKAAIVSHDPPKESCDPPKESCDLPYEPCSGKRNTALDSTASERSSEPGKPLSPPELILPSVDCSSLAEPDDHSHLLPDKLLSTNEPDKVPLSLSLPAEMAAAIRGRKSRNSEDIFS